jgi:hypothetical protein
MRNTIFKVLAAGLLLTLAAAVINTTGNVVAGLVAASAALSTVQAFGFGSITLFDLTGVAQNTALIGLKRKSQTLTIGGAKRLYLILAEDLTAEFLNYNLAKTAGKYAGPIPLETGKKAYEIEAWYDTTKFSTEMKTGAGFTQSFEFKVLGYNAETVKLAALLYETPVIVIVQGNDDQLYCLGQKYIPLMFDAVGTMPEKGTARKETSYSAKNDGMQVPAFPLDITATFEVTPLV